MNSPKGFLLIEALVAVLILSAALAASLGALGQALRLTRCAEAHTRAVHALEDLLFDLETGGRADLLRYGGKGPLEDYQYEIKSVPIEIATSLLPTSFYDLSLRLILNGGRDFLSIESFLKEGWFL